MNGRPNTGCRPRSLARFQISTGRISPDLHPRSVKKAQQAKSSLLRLLAFYWVNFFRGEFFDARGNGEIGGFYEARESHQTSIAVMPTESDQAHKYRENDS